MLCCAVWRVITAAPGARHSRQALHQVLVCLFVATPSVCTTRVPVKQHQVSESFCCVTVELWKTCRRLHAAALCGVVCFATQLAE